ncbi:MAG TPA: tryptophan synthase subunit alpha [Acidimicrobiales bacterium]|nr:tryptophan synthase subunit alpha [Acidimicrobiales bacterium]
MSAPAGDLAGAGLDELATPPGAVTGPVAASHHPGALERALRARREEGRKLLVPYVTGGLGEEWLDTVRAVAAAGADAVEIGIPFSDPVMDGPVIQAASQRALEAGATPPGIVDALRGADVDVPLAVMTYYNLVAHAGCRRMASTLAASGVAAAILPDLPVDEAGEWAAEADAAGVETVLLAAPTTPADRLARICARSRGFVYAVGLLGVTGERSTLGASAATIAARCKAVTDLPVLVGVGVSNASQAREICAVADGVVVGSALVRRLLEGAGPEGAARFVGELRQAIDAG